VSQIQSSVSPNGGASKEPSPIETRQSLRALKRATDMVVAGLGLVVLSPVFLAIAIAIKITSRGPIFFRQLRIGAHNEPFQIIKFRTMRLDADEVKGEFAHLNVHAQNGGDPRMFKILDDPRVTPLGRFLRRYFLDELPQLVNVLTGRMSLVGPRPLIPEEDEEVPEWARRRLRVRPGMTGMWQVHGHSAVPFEEMIRLDFAYVTDWSYAGDFKLILETIPLVVRGDGDRR
jgi:lipopolysaccharide/colanic/teichoic acid biosynthesis glycosyltransferase